MFFELIGVFILLIAWVNAVNLATARSQQRGREVCVRKMLGADSRQLVGRTARLAREMSREPATPEEARQMIGLPARKANLKDHLLKQVALSGK